MKPFGVCQFDDPDVASSGWISIAGEKAKRITGRGSLRQDVNWVTNLNFNQYRSHNLNNIPHIADAQYFRTSYDFVGVENGVIGEPDKHVEVASSVYSRITHCAKSMLGIDINSLGYRYSSQLNDVVIPRHVKKKLQYQDIDALSKAIIQSTQNIQIVTSNRPKGSKAVNFVLPRGPYSSWLLNQKVPSTGEWKELKKKQWSGTLGVTSSGVIRGSAAVIDGLAYLSRDHSAIFRVDIVSQNEDMAEFQMFGSGYKENGRTVSRLWATLPEVLHLSRFSKIKLNGGFFCPSGRLELSEIGDFGNSGRTEFSYSRGLFLENLWVSLCLPHKGDAKKPNAVGAYLRAIDRIACARAAEKFVDEAGISVGSFGVGRVTLFLKETELKEASDIALKHGLLPPISAISDEE